MRVTLDVSALAPQPGGIGRYTWQLCQGLAASPEIEELNFVANGRLVSDPSALLRGEARRPSYLMRKLSAARARRALTRTLVHGPNYFLPAGRAGATF